MLLRLEGVTRSFGSRTLFRDVALTIHRDDRIGLVGPNGAGKTTLLQIASGLDAPDSGRVEIHRDVRVELLRQEIDPNRTCSVRSEVASVFSALDALERELAELEVRMEQFADEPGGVPNDLANRYDECRTRFELGVNAISRALPRRSGTNRSLIVLNNCSTSTPFSGFWQSTQSHVSSHGSLFLRQAQR